MTASGRWSGVVALASALIGCGGAATPMRLTGALSVSLSSTHACALLEDGNARCWGEDVFGQLGDGQMTFAVARPVPVSGLSGLAAVVAGFGYSCGLVRDGAVACWGNDIWNQIGDETGDGGTSASSNRSNRHISVSAPTGVDGLGPVVDGLVTPGAADSRSAYTCAHMADETVQCWGQNALGLGGPTALGTTPMSLPGLLRVRAMAFGGSFGCFALDDGTVVCLGLGPLGQGQEFSASGSPVAVAGLSGVTGIAAGAFHACALINDGTVRCWGDWGGTNPTLVPAAVDGLAGVTAVAAGGFQTCALLGDGGVMCWGNTRSATPKRVDGLGAATAISVGGVYACAVIKGGTIQCWGDDNGGLLGDGVSPYGNGPRHNVPPVSVIAAADGGI